MPEGPEIYVTSLELHRDLHGKILKNIGILQPRRCTNFTTAVISDIVPAIVLWVSSKGKKLIFCCKTLQTGLEFVIGSFLAMEGHWGYDVIANHKNTKMYLEFDTFVLYYDDTRFGENTLIRTAGEYNHYLDRVGLDLIRDVDKVTPAVWAAAFRNKRIENKPVCEMLLEQHRFAGIGNYLRAEILYRAKIRPDKPLKDLTDDQIELLRYISITILIEAVKCKGKTIATYSTPNKAIGTFNCDVYDQSHDPHGYPVVTFKDKDDRTVHWCPHIQF